MKERQAVSQALRYLEGIGSISDVALTDEEVSKVYRRLFDSRDGQIVLCDLLDKCRYFKGPQLIPGGIDASAHIHSGQRMVCTHVLNMLGHVPIDEQDRQTQTVNRKPE